MICQAGGQWAWLASTVSFRFVKPVYVEDTATCHMRILEVDSKGRARAAARFHNPQGELVMEVELTGLLPSEAERALLRSMLEAGDPTNPISREETG